MTESNNEDTGKAQSDPKNTVASQQNASPDSEKQNSEDKPLKITKKDVKLLKDDARIAEITSHSLNESGVHEHGSHFAITFIALLIAMFVSSLSETVAAVALPTIVGDLGGVEIMQWVDTTYILTSTITMPLYGKLGDLIGRKYLLMSGLGIYALGKVVCAIAPNMGLLIAGRAISGLGGGGLIILSQATVADLVPPRKRGVYFGIMGSLFTVSSVLGPVLGGFFVDTIGWRFIFWFTVPLAALALVFLAIFLKQPPIKGVHPSIDYLGMIFLTVGVVSLVLNVGWAGTDYAYISWQTFVMAGIFVAAAVVFVLVERKVKEPVIPMYLFHNRNFVLCSIAGMLIYACFMGTMNYLPTYLEIVHEMNAIDAGLVGIPMSIFLFISSTGSGFIASRTGKYKWMMVIMAPIAVVGFFFMSTLGINTPVVFIMIYLAIIGFGIGCGIQLLVLVVQNEFPQAIVGTATAGNNFFRQIGSTVGVSVIGSVFTARLTANLADKIPASAHVTLSNLTPDVVDKLSDTLKHTIAEGYSDALLPLFIAFVPICVVIFILMIFIIPHPLATKIKHTGHTLPDEH